MARPSVEARAGDMERRMSATLDPQNFEPIFNAGNRVVETWLTIGSELLEFGKTRLDHTLEVSKAIARSGSVDEAVGLQADYARKLMQDYATQASKLADFGTKQLLESFKAWQAAGPRTAENVAHSAHEEPRAAA